MKTQHFLLVISLCLFFLDINAQNYELEWKDSIESHVSGYGIFFPILQIDSLNEAIYVAAHQQEVQTNIVLVKYDFEGNRIWESTIDFGFLDLLYDLKIDNEGNIYVLKNTFGLVKYSPFGELEWHLNYQLEGHIMRAFDFMFDENNDIFIVGRKSEEVAPNEFINNAHLIKVNGIGDVIWSKDYSFEIGWKLDIFNNNLNILGSTGSTYCIMNCTLEGDSLDLNHFYIDEFSPIYVTTDSEGNFYSGAWFEAYSATKVNHKAIIEWSYEYSPTNGISPQRSWYVKPDQHRNVYIAGEIYSDSTSMDVLVSKLDQYGNLVWEIKYDNQGDSLDTSVRDLFISTDLIAITGYNENLQGYHDSYLLIINTDGELISEIEPNSNLNYYLSGYSINEDLNKNLYLAGSGFRDDNFEFLDIYKYKPILLSERLVENSHNIQIFPNPFSSQITVTGAKESILIYDMFGRTIKSFICKDDPFTFNFETLPKGFYLISVKNRDFIFTKKIVKQ